LHLHRTWEFLRAASCTMTHLHQLVLHPRLQVSGHEDDRLVG
jgi:hypothetical protein